MKMKIENKNRHTDVNTFDLQEIKSSYSPTFATEIVNNTTLNLQTSPQN